MELKKISFATAESEALADMLSTLSEGERSEALEIINYYLSVDSEVSFAFSVVGAALLARCFDGADYYFVFPHEISERSNIYEAVTESVKYAVLEEIRPIFVSVPREDVRIFFDLGYRHVDCDADSEDGYTYRVSLKSELSFLDEAPAAESDTISLSPLSENDSVDYERLVSDEENNAFWGYDYREDYGEANGDFLISLATREFYASFALSLAIRAKRMLIGEAVLHAFDYKGGADISIRILPEHQNKGFGREALSLILRIAARIGLTRLYARVNPENLPSVSLFSKLADKKDEVDANTVFSYNLLSELI